MEVPTHGLVLPSAHSLRKRALQQSEVARKMAEEFCIKLRQTHLTGSLEITGQLRHLQES